MIETAILCLAMNIYFEARGEPVAGQIAVANVTMNRVKSPGYPDTVCGVVTQHKQFSWTIDKLKPVRGGFQLRKEHHPKDMKAWNRAVAIATNAVKGKYHDMTQGATFYHAVYVKPYWAKKKQRVLVVGNHIFYRKSKSLVSYNNSVNGRNS